MTIFSDVWLRIGTKRIKRTEKILLNKGNIYTSRDTFTVISSQGPIINFLNIQNA